MKHKVSSTILATSLAGCLTLATVGMLLIPTNTSAAYTVDFNDGIFSSWDGSTYTFDWYKNPTNVDGVTTYTISSASDLAGLAIITNDLSDSAFNYITDKLSTSDKVYATTVDNFEGKVVKLDTDVDLADYDWLSIGYPWNTPALTASTLITNTEGETVAYNAVDYIPDDTVDPWVGDKNGDPISTRYKEYPEAELRFRDLIKLNDGTETLHDLKDSTYELGDALLFHTGKSAYDYTNYIEEDVVLNTLKHRHLDLETDILVPYTFKDIKGYTTTKGFAGTFDGQDHKVKGLNPDTTWTDDTTERLTTYEPIARGLFSMLDEKGTIKALSVKGEYDSEICSYSSLLCAYNYGLIDSCYVDGQMSQALVEQIYPIARDYDPDGSTYKLSDTAGTVMPSGNAGFMTSQNYGTIINSYTVGKVTQAFRQFGFFASTNYGTIKNCENRANLSSSLVTTDFHTDEWSDDYCQTSSGAIDVMYTVTPSYLHTLDIDTTTQLQTQSMPLELYPRYSGWSITLIGYGMISLDSNLLSTVATTNESVSTDAIHRYSCLDTLYDPDHLHSWGSNSFCYNTFYTGHKGDIDIGSTILKDRYWMSNDWPTAFNTFLGRYSIMHQSVVKDSTKYGASDMWIPAIYNTTEGESIAANHLYGVYTETLAGGIAAVNYGELGGKNYGNIKALTNVSFRNNFKAVNDTEKYQSYASYYSYIRPNNAYGLFSTAGDTLTLAGGATAYNFGYINTFENFGKIEDENLDVYNTNYTCQGGTDDHLEVLTATKNGFYQNDVRINIEDMKNSISSTMQQYSENGYLITSGYGWLTGLEATDKQYFYTPYGFGWWVNDDNKNNYVNQEINGYTYDTYDRNMPYPYYQALDSKHLTCTACITPVNTSVVANTTNSGEGHCGIWYSYPSSYTNVKDEWLPTDYTYDTSEKYVILYNCTGNSNKVTDANLVDIATDTHILGCNSTLANNKFYSLANASVSNLVDVTISNCKIYKGVGIIEEINGTKTLFEDSVVYDKDSVLAEVILSTPAGIVHNAENTYFNNCITMQKCEYGLGWLTNCGMNNIYVLNTCVYNIFMHGSLAADANEVSNLYYIAPEGAMYGMTDITCANPIVYNNVNIYCFNTDGSLGRLKDESSGRSEGLGTFKNATFNGLTCFANTNLQYINATNCEFNDVVFFGDTLASANEFTTYSYEYYLKDCTLNNAILQTKLNIVQSDYYETGKVDLYPGVISNINTNTFTNSIIQVPNGVLSVPSYNVGSKEETILSDIQLVYAGDSRVNGALAYYLDRGNTSNRTYEWTVAQNDTISVDDILPDFIDTDLVTTHSINLPSHTRKIQSDSEKPFYRISAPITDKTAGTVNLSLTNDFGEQSTSVDSKPYIINIYGQEEDIVDISTSTNRGYELLSLNQTIDGELTELNLDTEQINFTDKDQTIYAVWKGIYLIDYDTSLTDIANLYNPISGSAATKTVKVDPQLKDSSVAISKLYYCPFVKDNNNKIKIDYDSKTEIPLATMEFIMPETNICIFAEVDSNAAEITKFVLAGTEGVIIDGTITVTLSNSTDLTNIIPDSIIYSDKATISPAIDVAQDFTNPIKYTVTSQSGDVKHAYTIKVSMPIDGAITDFEVYGVHADINQETHTITLKVSEILDLSNVQPTIKWTGASLTPDISTPIELVDGMTFTVTSSTGVDTPYTLHIERAIVSDVITNLEFDNKDLSISVDDVNNRITVVYPYGTDVSNVYIKSLGYIGENATLQQGTYIDLTVHNSLAIYSSGGSKVYDIIATELPNPAKAIVNFSIYGISGDIDDETKTITLNIPEKYDITNVMPDPIFFAGKSISDSYVKKNFTQPVTYTVTAYDDSTVEYTVIVNSIKED